MDKNIVLLIAGAVVVLFLKAILTRQRRPKNPIFSCSRCRKAARHDSRTIRAWQAGKEKFFCAPCHRSWLATHPTPVAPARSDATRRAEPHVTRGEAPSPPSSTERGAASPRTDGGATVERGAASRPVRANARGGCLGVTLLLIGLPAGLAIAWLCR